MASHYTRSAGPQRLAKEAMHQLANDERASIPHLATRCGRKAEKQMKSTAKNIDGGPGRTRTSNQTVMSEITSPEISATFDFFRHVRSRLFTFGCGHPLAKRWSPCTNESRMIFTSKAEAPL
jgi:hypothetical protein